MRSRHSSQRKDALFEVSLFLLILLIGGYMIYDLYFRLPSSPSLVSPSAPVPVPDEKLAVDRFDILLLGLDGREGLNDRSDTLILVSVDEKNKKAQLLSIPRDTRVKVRGKLDKINAAYAYGGVDLSKKTVTDFLGVTIDRYVIINFNSLVKLVEQVGGIDVNVPFRMYNRLEGIDLQPGAQHLDGKQVLAYTRYRDSKHGDRERAQRQQEVLQLLAVKVLEGKSLPQITNFINFVLEEVETDLTAREMVALARLVSPVLANGVTNKILPGEGKKIDNIWYYEADLTDLEKIMHNS